MKSNEALDKCLNCARKIDPKDQYCSNCGQKNTDGRVKIYDLLKDFFSDQLSLDSKLFRTICALFIPARLTKAYFQGKHKSYIGPLRLFFFLAIAAIGLAMAYAPKNSALKSDTAIFETRFLEQRQMITSLIDSIEVLKALYTYDTNKVQLLDSLESMFVTGKESILIDSFPVNLIAFSITDVEGTIIEKDSSSIMVAVDDLIEMPSKQLFELYNIEGFRRQILFSQLRKTLLDGNNFNTFLVSNIPWILLFMMPALALILKIIYFRRSFYYIEHLIFSFHIHAFLSAIAIIWLILFRWAGFIIPFGPLMIGIWGFIFLSITRYYDQSIFKSFLKLFLIVIAYLILASLFLIFGAAISVLLF
ncbi:MAG: DUF3667 domain-containing protein [Bacteroidia bacterium]|nr:DUF3667 domain-containing protein [Bacteroidia bacterium]